MKKASCLVPAPPSVASNVPDMTPYNAPASVYAPSTAFIPLCPLPQYLYQRLRRCALSAAQLASGRTRRV